MFSLRSAPLRLEAGGLEGLRLSLNAPVVDGGDLPTGPARAALLVHRDRTGGLGVTVGVRSERIGQVALYTLDETVARNALAMAVDAALSFGESMGFLFDDDELERGGRRRALRLWQERFGAETEPEVALEPLGCAPEPAGSAAGDGCDELLLDDLADGISAWPPGLPLSKFRSPAAGPDSAGEGSAAEPCGAPPTRVRLVCRPPARQEDGGDRDRILRLLAAF